VFQCNVLPDHRPYIIMELIDGETLTSRLGDRDRLSWPDVAALMADVADVLAAVHTRGIVHRDLKPDNLLLTPGDRDFPVRVIDWGVARLGAAGRLTLEGLTPGTPIYMSPDQAAGHHIAAPCDIYSLGVIAYEALTGHPPFDGRTLAEVVCKHLTTDPLPLGTRCGAPAELCDLVHRMLDKDPARRPMAVDVRRLARELVRNQALLATTPIEVIECTVDVDPAELEFGVTELVPSMRKSRWTPQLAQSLRAEAIGNSTPRRRRKEQRS
jgi:serine/threonine protein kinase